MKKSIVNERGRKAMEKFHDQNLTVLRFSLLMECSSLNHGVFTRNGGFSEGDFSSLNLSCNVGDNLENVQKNIQAVSTYLGNTKLFFARQNHGTKIEKIDSLDSVIRNPCDILCSNVPGAALMITHADCQAAIFYDPIHHAIANAHCGWRGSVQNVYARTIEFMKNHFGSRPEDLLIAISPSISKNALELVNYKEELPQTFWQFQDKENYFDFWEISREQLKNAGVLSHHIEVAGICTFANKDDFFSYRRSKNTGRNATFVQLL